jgi:hypothetical protein
VTFIPLNVIPKVNRPLFKTKTLPAVLYINDKHYVPVKEDGLKPII